MKPAQTIVFLIATLVALPTCGHSDDIGWAKFVDHAQRIGSFGEWTLDAVTKNMWVGIPAGIKYTATEESRLSEDGTRVIGSYIWKTEDGRVISIGSGVTFFDTKRRKIVRRGSGFDMGEPYDGLHVLQEMGDSMVWLYTENSQGKTTRYRTIERMVDRNHVEWSTRRADGTGPTMSSVRRRTGVSDDATEDVWTAFVNEIEANGVLGEFTLRGVTDDLWAGIPAGLEYTAVDSTMLTKDRTRLIQTHMWMAEDGTVISSGSQVTYYDPKTARIKRSQSGFDMGELFYGTSKLVRSGAAQEWIYTEHSRGKVTDYRIISKSIDWDNMELSWGLADGSSAMTTLRMQRVD